MRILLIYSNFAKGHFEGTFGVSLLHLVLGFLNWIEVIGLAYKFAYPCD